MTDAGKNGAFNDPDADNAEQAEAGTQAQDVTADALEAATDLAEESVPGGPDDPTRPEGGRTPDLVDRMERMKRSGTIDMGAYAGEADMDDEEGALPPDDAN